MNTRAVLRGLERLLKLLGRGRDVVGRASWGKLPLVRVCAAGEVIGRALAGKRLVTEVLEVGTRLGRRAEEDLTALIEDDDLVEEFVDTLARLVPAYMREKVNLLC